MSRFTQLAIVLSLAACEHAAPTSPPPQFPEQPVEPPPAEPAVAPEPAPPPAPEPAIAPVTTPPKKLVKKHCNPMSRAGCRWVEETDERELPRVIKKEEHVQ